jgi:hypothetical protein
VNLDVAIIRIGLATQQRLKLHAPNFGHQFLKLGLAFGAGGLVTFRLGHFVQLDTIRKRLGDAAKPGDEIIDPRALAHDFLRGFGVIPKLRVLGLRIQRIGLTQQIIPVKGTSRAGFAMTRIGLLGI